MNESTSDQAALGDLIVDIGRLFIGKPYRDGMLENPGKEKLIINVSAFDCTTFVETVLAFFRCAASGRFSSGAFKKYLKLIRYRGGKISGYSSRLHYFTDWMRNNIEKKFLIDITGHLQATPHRKKIDFMSTHPELYPALKNKVQLAKVIDIEKMLSRKAFPVMNKEKLGTRIKKIQSGDVIAFASNQQGLDVAHVGFALWQGNSLRLLHASRQEGKVVISKKTLLAYLTSNKKFTGIIVARSVF